MSSQLSNELVAASSVVAEDQPIAGRRSRGSGCGKGGVLPCDVIEPLVDRARVLACQQRALQSFLESEPQSFSHELAVLVQQLELTREAFRACRREHRHPSMAGHHARASPVDPQLFEADRHVDVVRTWIQRARKRHPECLKAGVEHARVDSVGTDRRRQLVGYNNTRDDLTVAAVNTLDSSKCRTVVHTDAAHELVIVAATQDLIASGPRLSEQRGGRRLCRRGGRAPAGRGGMQRPRTAVCIGIAAEDLDDNVSARSR